MNLAALIEAAGLAPPACGHADAESTQAYTLRVRREFEEMPGLHLTVAQAARLFGLAPEVAHAVLEDLRRASALACSARGTYSLNR
jgi:hypothetical protein